MTSNLLAAGLVAAAAAASAAPTAEQVHISLTGRAGEMYVAWTTVGACEGNATVLYGQSLSALETATAESSLFTDGMTVPICIFGATLTGMTPSTKYYYQAGDAAVEHFISAPAVGTSGVVVYALMADFGLANDISLDQLVQEALDGSFEVLLHAGDLAYDLNTAGGSRGDIFMNAIEPIVSRVPYMTIVGNHEHAFNFTHFQARFPGNKVLAENSNSDNSLWYSFDHALTHFINIDTELYHYCEGSSALCLDTIASQLAWLAADVAAVDRAVTPWVIAQGHKQGWMDSLGRANFTAVEDILQGGGVDLYLTGHQHNYVRTLPNAYNKPEECYSADMETYTNCKLMVTLVVGSPGCREQISTGGPSAAITAVKILSYGYGHLSIFNESHIYWMWEETATNATWTGLGTSTGRGLRGLPHRSASVEVAIAAGTADQMWIIKDQH